MTDEEALRKFEEQLQSAQAVLDSGFGMRSGENNWLYLRRKEMAVCAISALRERIERNNVTTNAEKIRAMSDEEIAAFACLNAAVFTPCDIICNGDCKAYASFGCTSEDACKKIVLNWLKQPCKEDK